MHGARGFGAASFYCVPVVYRARNASSCRCNAHAGTTDCTMVPWTGTRVRYAGHEKQAESWTTVLHIKVGGEVPVASSSPHMCVPNGQRYQVTWVHALQDDKTRRNALCWQRT